MSAENAMKAAENALVRVYPQEIMPYYCLLRLHSAFIAAAMLKAEGERKYRLPVSPLPPSCQWQVASCHLTQTGGGSINFREIFVGPAREILPKNVGALFAVRPPEHRNRHVEVSPRDPIGELLGDSASILSPRLSPFRQRCSPHMFVRCCRCACRGHCDPRVRKNCGVPWCVLPHIHGCGALRCLQMKSE